MIRKAWIMEVFPDKHAEYQKRHNPVWPEMHLVLQSHGVHNYSIFLQPESNQLFAYVEIEDEAQWAAISKTSICQKWWKHMKDVMPANPDNSPTQKDVQEVFHMD